MRERSYVFKRCSCLDPVDGRPLGVRCPRLSEDRHGSWYFSLELPAGRAGGRQRMRRGGFASREAAVRARAFLLGEDVDLDRAVVTTGQWLDLWLEMRTALSFNTHRIYSQHIRHYVKPHLGGAPLRELTAGRVQAMFTCLMRTPGASGKPLVAGHAAQGAGCVARRAQRGDPSWVD